MQTMREGMAALSGQTTASTPLGDGYSLVTDGVRLAVCHTSRMWEVAEVVDGDVDAALAQAKEMVEKPAPFLCQAATAQALAKALDRLLPGIRVGVVVLRGQDVLKESGGPRHWTVELGAGESLFRAVRLRRSC